MKSKKLFATDFDGTLNKYAIGISDRSREMIKKFRDEGNIFGIVTGRNYLGATWVKNDAGDLCDFIMCMTGAYAMDGEGSYLFDSKGDGSILPEVMHLLRSEKCRYLSYCDKEEVFDVPIDGELPDDGEIMREIRRHSNFTQINTAFEDYEQMEHALKILNERFGDKLNPQTNYTCVDIPPYGVSKGEAVGRLADYFGVSRKNIFTAGDNINDISMLKAHYGFAVEGSNELVINSAKETFFDVGDMIERAMELDFD